MSSRSLVALVALLAGCARTWPMDPPEIQARFASRHVGQCNAWVASQRTGYRYCSSPAFLPDATLGAYEKASSTGRSWSKADGPTDADSLKAHGEGVYTNACASCHQANGEGLAGVFPPLKGAGSFYGSAANHAKIIRDGLSGEIEVNGVKYSGAMPPKGGAPLTDYDIAAVATYERLSWGNNDGPVTPDDVKGAQ
ncbi:MAG: cytochrome c [Deltaproteobacteria bacterium]|nr:cytochrome c [Deltaproteobacteria bacterium]